MWLLYAIINTIVFAISLLLFIPKFDFTYKIVVNILIAFIPVLNIVQLLIVYANYIIIRRRDGKRKKSIR